MSPSPDPTAPAQATALTDRRRARYAALARILTTTEAVGSASG